MSAPAAVSPPDLDHARLPRPPLTWEDVQQRLQYLADLLDDLVQPAVQSLTDDVRLRSGTLCYVVDTVREFAARCPEEGAREGRS